MTFILSQQQNLKMYIDLTFMKNLNLNKFYGI